MILYNVISALVGETNELKVHFLKGVLQLEVVSEERRVLLTERRDDIVVTTPKGYFNQQEKVYTKDLSKPVVTRRILDEIVPHLKNPVGQPRLRNAIIPLVTRTSKEVEIIELKLTPTSVSVDYKAEGQSLALNLNITNLSASLYNVTLLHQDITEKHSKVTLRELVHLLECKGVLTQKKRIIKPAYKTLIKDGLRYEVQEVTIDSNTLTVITDKGVITVEPTTTSSDTDETTLNQLNRGYTDLILKRLTEIQYANWIKQFNSFNVTISLS